MKQLPLGSFTPEAVEDLLAGVLNTIPASGALQPRQAGRFLITKAGVAVLTLAAPSLQDDGLLLQITSVTANAHTLTATDLLNTGAAANDVATFAAFAGAGLTLMAYNGGWYVLRQIGIIFS